MESNCIEWTGGIDFEGYGRRKINGKTYRAHRLVWETANGPIPPDMLICHKCDNPACVRLEHLFLGTTQDNTRDRDSKGRQARPKGERNAVSG